MADDAKELTRQVVAYGLDEQWNRAVEAAAKIADETPHGWAAARNIRRLRRDPARHFTKPEPEFCI